MTFRSGVALSSSSWATASTVGAPDLGERSMRDELRKRILYVENGVGFGGAVISLRTFLSNADLERFPAVLLHSLEDPKFESFDPLVKTLYVPKVNLPDTFRFARWANLDVLKYAMKIIGVAHRERVNALYLNNDLITNLSGLIAGSVLRVPVIQHERDIPVPSSRLATSLSSRVTRVLAISNSVRAALERMGVPSERIRMVPEGLDLSLYRPVRGDVLAAIRGELGIVETDRVVVMVGMVMDWKGQHVLIDAAPMVLEHHPRAKFVIVGESPVGAERYAKGLKEKVARLGLRERVVFAGYRDDVPAVIQTAVALVHASTSPEPFGRVVIEGMAMSRPVIATNIGAPPEIVRDGETGFLVAPAAPKELAEVINRIFDRPDEARAVGERAHDEVMRKYSIRRHANLIESVFEELFWGTPPALPSAVLG